jgi:hypothetical protein
MPKFHVLLADNSGFTADTEDITIHRIKYLHQLILSLYGENSGATSVSWDNLLGLIDKLTLKLNGVPKIDISGPDLFALANYLLGVRPLGITSGNATSNPCRVMGIPVPVALPIGPETLTYKLSYAPVSGLTNTKYTLMAEYADATIWSPPYTITTYSYTPPSTGALNKALSTITKGALEGILIYATSVPSSTSNTKTVNKVEVRVGGVVQLSDSWESLRAAVQAGSVAADTVSEKILDNYVFLDLRGDPIPAGSSVDVFINSDDIQPVRLILVERA